MNEPGTDPNISRPIDDGSAVETLRRQVNLLLAALLISSLTLTGYLALQARRASADFMNAQARAMEQFKQNQQDVASIQTIYTKLAEFGRTHPDFQKQVLSRYRFNTNAPPAPAKK